MSTSCSVELKSNGNIVNAIVRLSVCLSCYLLLNHRAEFYQTCYITSPHGKDVQEQHYSVTLICQSPRELRNYFELSEVQDKQIVMSPIYMYKLSTLVESPFLQCTCTFQYRSTCAHSHTVSTENGIVIKK